MILHDRAGEPFEIHPKQVEVVGEPARPEWGADVCWLPVGAKRPVVLKAREPLALVVGLLERRGIEVKVIHDEEKRDG